jgi:pyruvate ferredoxin oxidoreductase gamma subunit
MRSGSIHVAARVVSPPPGFLPSQRSGTVSATAILPMGKRRAHPLYHVRIDDHPIRIYSQIRNPDLVVVLDTSVMEAVDVLHGLKPGGWVLINAPKAEEIPGHRSYPVDLTGIALSLGLVIAGSPVLDTPVLGALAKMGIISLESAKAAITEMFSDERNLNY